MKTIALILVLMSLAASAGRAAFYPAVVLTPETLEKEGFEILVTSKADNDGMSIVVGFLKVPLFLEERCETSLRVREGNSVSLDAPLQRARGIRVPHFAYSFKIPREHLPRAELYISEGTQTTFDHKIILPLARFVKVE